MSSTYDRSGSDGAAGAHGAEVGAAGSGVVAVVACGRIALSMRLTDVGVGLGVGGV